MGLELLANLLQKEDVELMIVNRGNSYWGNTSQDMIEKSKVVVHQVKADRKLDSYSKTIFDALMKL